MVPRPPAGLDPQIERWEAGRVIVRCHGPKYHERQFNDTTYLARFRPLVHGGAVVPTIYGADDFPGAVSETVFHEVPVRGPHRRILRSAIDRWVWCEVAPTRDLNLVALHGSGRYGGPGPELTVTLDVIAPWPGIRRIKQDEAP